MEITSINNKTVQAVVNLKDKKHRVRRGLFVVEGIRMVRDAIKYASVQSIFIDKNRKDYIEEITNYKLQTTNIDIYTTEDYIISKMSSLETSQGILATVAINNKTLAAPAKNAVVLDNLQDPGNAGSIMRTALAAGITDIYFVNSVDPYNQKAVKASMSAVFHLNIYVAEKADEILPFMPGIICADMDGENVFTMACPAGLHAFALIIGNEGAGVSKEFLSAGKTVAIPMDKRVESLNAAASAAVLLYALTQKK